MNNHRFIMVSLFFFLFGFACGTSHADKARERLFRSIGKEVHRKAGTQGLRVRRLTLKNCVETALKKNSLLVAAEQKVGVAEAVKAMARASYIGKLELQCGRTRFNDDLYAQFVG